MAYDKVVDSSVLDAGLKQIADAIREKAGTSDNLAFPTAMAEAIAAIEAGGGSGASENIKITSGTYTPSEDTENLVIEQDFGGTPFALLLWNSSGTRNNHIQSAVFILTGSESYQTVKSLACVQISNAKISVGPLTNTLTKGEWGNGYIRTPTLKQGYTYYMRASVTQSWEVYAI